MDKHWTLMTNEEILEVRDKDWPDRKHDDPITDFVATHMRNKTADQYRRILMNRDRANRDV